MLFLKLTIAITSMLLINVAVMLHHYRNKLLWAQGIDRPVFILSKDEWGDPIHDIEYDLLEYANQKQEYEKLNEVMELLQVSKNPFYNLKFKGLSKLTVGVFIFQSPGHETETWEQYIHRAKVGIKNDLSKWCVPLEKKNEEYFYKKIFPHIPIIHLNLKTDVA